MHGNVLIIEDNEELAFFLEKLVRNAGFDASSANTGGQARKAVALAEPDVVLMDIMLPDANGLELMKELKETHTSTEFIMMTAHASIRTAIESIRCGALDYLTKPFDGEELIILLQKTIKNKVMKDEIRILRSKETGLPAQRSPEEYPSPAMREVMQLCISMAQGQGTILLTGESGSGKNYLAAIIHRLSPRATGPFFDINCASLAPSLAESELFGHEPGAFTGARGRKRGLLELADGGTLFLDEIGDMSLPLQSRLLTFLDTHTLRRVGGESKIEVNARIIAATNHDLARLVLEKEFREDLFYRLNVLTIHVPALRERIEDLPIMVQALCAKLAQDMALKDAPLVDAEGMKILKEYQWPGNVRELKNILERAVMLSPNKKEILSHLISTQLAKHGIHLKKDEMRGEAGLRPGPAIPAGGIDMKTAVAEMSKKLIEEALDRAKTKKEAAALLNISYDAMAHYIKKYKIEP